MKVCSEYAKLIRSHLAVQSRDAVKKRKHCIQWEMQWRNTRKVCNTDTKYKYEWQNSRALLSYKYMPLWYGWSDGRAFDICNEDTDDRTARSFYPIKICSESMDAGQQGPPIQWSYAPRMQLRYAIKQYGWQEGRALLPNKHTQMCFLPHIYLYHEADTYKATLRVIRSEGGEGGVEVIEFGQGPNIRKKLYVVWISEGLQY